MMKRIIRIAMVLLGCLVWSAAGAGSGDGGRAIRVVKNLSHHSGKLGDYRALIIGIDDYEDERIPDLKTPVNDARSMAKLLHEKYGFQVELMLDQEATKAAIYKKLRSLAASTKPDDSLLIYYAGHGELDKQYNDGWWIPVDARAGDPLTYLDNVQVQKAMRNMTARHVLLISDSCYSGTLFGRARAMPPVITDQYYLNLYNEKSRWGMTSGNKTPVSDRGTGGHSIFAYQLLRALNKNQKPYVSTQELFAKFANIVGNNSEQTPLCRPVRNTGDQGGEFIFVASGEAPVSRPSPAGSRTTLSVSANVAGAGVRVDGKMLGKTPLSDAPVSPGGHDIRVEKEGYGPYRKKIRLEAGRPMSLHVELSESRPPKGRLFVETIPAGATVRVMNIGPVFYQGMVLDPGPYHLAVSARKYREKRMWVELSAGEDKNISIRLEPVPVKQGAVTWQARRKLTNSLGMEFVYIPPGSFMMGSPSGESGRDDDERRHRVTLTAGFYMQTTEVTQGQWKRVMGNNPSRFSRCGNDCPVERVSWDDCLEFIRKLNRMEGGDKYRLPTEAEWEYAARAGTETAFARGGITATGCRHEPTLDAMGWYCGNSGKRTHAVAQKKPNAWGLYDMHGNVWEWCRDWYGDYPSGSVTDPEGPSSGAVRVDRGGGWGSVARYCRSADRGRGTPDHGFYYLGFRLVRAR